MAVIMGTAGHIDHGNNHKGLGRDLKHECAEKHGQQE